MSWAGVAIRAGEVPTRKDRVSMLVMQLLCDTLMSQSPVEDAVVNSVDPVPHSDETAASAIPAVTLFDARRPDRIAKSHLRAIQLLYENFVRSLTLSLSAYLRNYVSLNLSAVDQLSYRQFLDRLPPCSSMASAGMQPFGGAAIFEIDSALTFSVLEILLGGPGKVTEAVGRELTEIEQMLMDGLFRIIAHDLSEAWKNIGRMEFEMISVGAEAQFGQAMSAAEAVLAAKIEMRLGESTGSMNIALPSAAVNRVSQKFEQERSTRKSDTPADEQAHVFGLVQGARLEIEARLPEQRIRARELLSLEKGDVLALDLRVDAPANLILNGQVQFSGSIVNVGRKRAVQLSGPTAV